MRFPSRKRRIAEENGRYQAIGQLRTDYDYHEQYLKALDARIDGAVADITALREQIQAPAPAPARAAEKDGTT